MNRILLTAALFFLSLSTVFAQNWSDDEKKLFRDACMNEARVTMTQKASAWYCDCIVSQLVIEFPDGAYDTLITTEVVERIAEKCIRQAEREFGEATYKATWDDASKKTFIASCTRVLEDTSVEGEKYCSCVLEKIMVKYPDPQFIDRIPEVEIERLARECK
jgi:hypothetical protein